MAYIVYPVKRQGREFIGDSVVRVLKEITRTTDCRIVSILPKMLDHFDSGGRLEVTKADIIVED